MRHFAATQTLKLTIPDAGISIEQYLQNPQRLVQALTQITQVHQLDATHYRIELRPLNFLSLSLRPQITVQVWTDDHNILHLESREYSIDGVDLPPEKFALDLKGQLVPDNSDRQANLQGEVSLQVDVKLPPSLGWLPNPAISSAGNALVNGILMTIKSRLKRQLRQDYEAWAKEQSSGEKRTGVISSPSTPS